MSCRLRILNDPNEPDMLNESRSGDYSAIKFTAFYKNSRSFKSRLWSLNLISGTFQKNNGVIHFNVELYGSKQVYFYSCSIE